MRHRLSRTTVLILLLLVFLALKLWQSQQPRQPPARRQARSPASVEPLHSPYAHELRKREYGLQQSRPASRKDRSRRQEETGESCEALGVSCTSEYFRSWQSPEDGTCEVRLAQGSYPLPDDRCTPGGINPSITAEVLRDPRWRTRCTRNCQVSEAEKHQAYKWYGIRKPRPNSGENQVCELDHLVPLELGGADGSGNIWAQCGPTATELDARYFKLKDRVENYLADQVKTGRISLQSAQHGIASDWTRYLPAANLYCSTGGRC